LATDIVITTQDRVVQWLLGAASGTKDAAGHIAWWMSSSANIGTAADHAKQPPDTGTFWYVKTITYMPDVATATGGYITLYDNNSSGPILWKCLLETAVDVYSQTYDPPLRCRPTFYSTLSAGWSTKDYIVFHLA